jgi:hypothetical protein
MRIPISITSQLAEETGWHIGDGSMNFYKKIGKHNGFYQLRGHIEDDKPHYINRIKPIFKLLYDLEISLREMPKTRVFGFQIWNNDLVKFKQKLGLPLGKKFEVFIPKTFLKSEELKKAVIRGIFDTDGGIYLEPKNNKLYPRMEIRTISERLGKQVCENLISLGLRATIYSQLFDSDFNRQRIYVITIRGTEMFEKFMKIIQPANSKHIGKYEKYLDSKGL